MWVVISVPLYVFLFVISCRYRTTFRRRSMKAEGFASKYSLRALYSRFPSKYSHTFLLTCSGADISRMACTLLFTFSPISSMTVLDLFMSYPDGARALEVFITCKNKKIYIVSTCSSSTEKEKSDMRSRDSVTSKTFRMKSVMTRMDPSTSHSTKRLSRRHESRVHIQCTRVEK